LTKLNPAQLEAIRHTSSPLLVLAGAGSGKTRVITHKIAHLIGHLGIRPQHIAAVTFTNKAAREMRERVAGLSKGGDSRGLTICTFHTLGLTILRREYARAGYRNGFSIIDQQDAEAILRGLLREDADPEMARPTLWRISQWKNGLLDPADARSNATDELEARQARLYADYQRQLLAYNAVDFDDLILQPVQLFRRHPEILGHWQDKIRYLLVDEYQDTDGCQYQLVNLIVGIRRAFTVVGDDDQSIYSWRGARPDNLARLQRDFPDLAVIKLEQNYRSTGRILSCANRLIANNPHLFEKRLWSQLGSGDPIRVIACRDEEHEARRVVTEILSQRFRNGGSYGDYAILYRGNHQARPLEKVLREHSIPYFLSGGTSFFARSEIKDVMAYLRLLGNSEDDAAFLRIVNVPRREIGPSTLEKLAQYAAARKISLLNACDELGLAQHLSSRPLERLQEFAAGMHDYSRRAAADHPVEALRSLLRELDYESWIFENSPSESTGQRRMENVGELIDWAKRLHDEAEPDDRTLGHIAGRLALFDILERQDEESSEERVSLLTLHAAKGLEFPYVFLVGVEEELLPHRTSLEEDNIEEERRLAYVGLTRARKQLTLSFARRRKRYGELLECTPSRFIEELPSDELSWEGEGFAKDPERQREIGNAHLSNLRNLLS